MFVRSAHPLESLSRPHLLSLYPTCGGRTRSTSSESRISGAMARTRPSADVTSVAVAFAVRALFSVVPKNHQSLAQRLRYRSPGSMANTVAWKAPVEWDEQDMVLVLDDTTDAAEVE